MWRTGMSGWRIVGAGALLVISVTPWTAGAQNAGSRDMDEAAIAAEIDASHPAAGTACARAANAALVACHNEMRDDYWVTVGKCLNLSDDKERQECLAEAAAAREEHRELCREQFEARRDVCDLMGGDPYDPDIDPEDFLTPEQAAADPHPYFPLVPGTRWLYVSGDETIEVIVTEDTKEIMGVECFVIHDVVKLGGVVIEDTDDWYAKDDEGNVWYFGELTRTFEDGELASLEGSWEAGVNRDKPGIIMESMPEVGDAYRQEFSFGDVEDVAEVTSVTASEAVPVASCDGDCIVTAEWSPIEPGIVKDKYYTPGVGLMLEVNPATGEREELVEFNPGSPRLAASVARPVLRAGASSEPNPFRSETTLRFALGENAEVKAEVYDATGRRIRTLGSGRLGAGSHLLRWNGKDAADRDAAAGIYFIRIQTGTETMSHKVVLVR